MIRWNRLASAAIPALVLIFADTPRRPEPDVTPKAALRDDGTLLVHGRPTLPFGFYISTGHTGDRRLRCVEDVAAIGGNLVHIEGPWDEDIRFLDRAAELGVHVVAGHTATEAKLPRVIAFKDHPAIIAWTICDDANVLSNVADLKAMNRLIKRASPDRLTLIPIGTHGRKMAMPGPGFYECSDIVGWENYPIAGPGAVDPTLRATETQMESVRITARDAGRPIWLLPQTFAWPGQRPPSPDEFRNMCYVGLINGAKGLLSWCIYFKGDSREEIARKEKLGEPIWREWSLPDDARLWAECRRVAGEMKGLAPILLRAAPVKVSAGEGLSAAIWDGRDEALAIVANLSAEKPATAAIPLPASMKDFRWAAEFAGRPSGLSARAGLLVGKVGPAEVMVYRGRPGA